VLTSAGSNPAQRKFLLRVCQMLAIDKVHDILRVKYLLWCVTLESAVDVYVIRKLQFFHPIIQRNQNRHTGCPV
jgi:hypothetical protein